MEPNPIAESASQAPREVVGTAPTINRWARLTFVVLFLMTTLDYLDRNVLYAVLPQVKKAFDLTDAQTGRLATYFLIAYSVFSIFTGYAGDRLRRTYLLSLGVGVWSLATIGSGLAQSYGQLALARAVLGIGEATYGVIAPTLLLDLFAKEQRARIMSGFYLAMPIGSALGMALGGWIAMHYDWHLVFFLVGAPGLLAALAVLFLPEPVRGATEGIDPERLAEHQSAGASREDYVDLMVNSSYTYCVFGMTMYTFAIGGLLVWVPTFLTTARGVPQDRATLILGLVTLGSSLVGMSAGGWISDRLAKSSPRALFIVPGLAMLASIPFVVLGLFARSEPLIFAGIFLAEALMFVNTGPCYAIIANVVMPNMRGAAYAVAVFVMHFLGDIWSPWLIGEVSDYCGKPDTMATPFGAALKAIGATPTLADGAAQPSNLTAGLLIVLPAIALSGLVLLSGARHLPREMALMLAKLKAAPRPRAVARR